jgi:hypothetical protein
LHWKAASRTDVTLQYWTRTQLLPHFHILRSPRVPPRVGAQGYGGIISTSLRRSNWDPTHTEFIIVRRRASKALLDPDNYLEVFRIKPGPLQGDGAAAGASLPVRSAGGTATHQLVTAGSALSSS